MNDPYSLYTDDTAIFLSDITQLAVILKHIEYIGTFTGLYLNMNKTIAFDPNASNKIKQAGIEVGFIPVKYLGAYLGLGDLTKLNFDLPLKKARAIVARWNKYSLTLDACILVAKTFIFSIFVHVISMVSIKVEQLDVIQKLLLDFIWRGRLRMKMSVFAAPFELGGMKMLHICNVVHALRVKWIKHICDDRGFT